MADVGDSSHTNEKMNASIPASARESMQQAADTNPTENRVFDVKLLLEQITANFATFKNDVKDKIFELLVWEVNYGFGTFKFKDFAECVYTTVHTLGFREIECWEKHPSKVVPIILGQSAFLLVWR